MARVHMTLSLAPDNHEAKTMLDELATLLDAFSVSPA
jgi:hypothetical protein